MARPRPYRTPRAPALLLVAGAAVAVLTGCGGGPAVTDVSPAVGGDRPPVSPSVEARSNGSLEPASAMCAAPELSATPADLAPGAELELSGRYFLTVCNDTGQGDVGNENATYPILWEQGGVSHDLGSVETVDHAFAVDLVVPDDAQPGTATITVGHTTVEVLVG